MATVYILGAGASHSYDASPTGVRPPLSSGFFRAYCDLDISGDIEVRVGDIVSYVGQTYGVPYEAFCTFDENIEAFMTRLDGYVQEQILKIREPSPSPEDFGELVNRVHAHDQLVFLIGHVLNEVQNGPVSEDYSAFVSSLRTGDTVVTFNWDTLLDRALETHSAWTPDSGYGVQFHRALEDKWRRAKRGQGTGDFTYLKLHGSTSWLVNYNTWHLGTGDRIMVSTRHRTTGRQTLAFDPMYLESVSARRTIRPRFFRRRWSHAPIPNPPDPDAFPCLFIQGKTRFAAYKGRFRPGYERFSYFFPPDHPDTRVPLMPLIIPPTSFKLYDEFRHVFDPLWDTARIACSQADRIVLLGYSLPATDTRALNVLQEAAAIGNPHFTVVSPHPEPIASRIAALPPVEDHRIDAVAATFRDFLA